jgi:hypothetical protein
LGKIGQGALCTAHTCHCPAGSLHRVAAAQGQQNQFRLALLERRLKVFDSTAELIGKVLRQAKVNLSDLSEFLMGTDQREFLFGSDIAAYLDEVYGKASDFHALEGAADEEPKQKRMAALKWFSGQGDEAKKKFSIYMAFKDID